SRQCSGVQNPQVVCVSIRGCFNEPSRKYDDRFYWETSVRSVLEQVLQPIALSQGLPNGISLYLFSIYEQLFAVVLNICCAPYGLAVSFCLNNKNPLRRHHHMVEIETVSRNVMENLAVLSS